MYVFNEKVAFLVAHFMHRVTHSILLTMLLLHCFMAGIHVVALYVLCMH